MHIYVPQYNAPGNSLTASSILRLVRQLLQETASVHRSPVCTYERSTLGNTFGSAERSSLSMPPAIAIVLLRDKEPLFGDNGILVPVAESL